jgi:hypothetical protein
MKARVVVVAVVAGVVVAGLFWGLRAGQRAIARFKEETHQKVVQAEREAMSRAQSATAEAEREGREEEKLGKAPEGKASEESFFVKSITIDGLDEAGMTAADLGDIEIEMEKSGEGALGRPTAGRVRMGSLMRPVSPLTLYAAEVARMTAAVVQAVKDRGYVGISIEVGERGKDRSRLVDGDWSWRLFVVVVDSVEVEDLRAVKAPAADLEAIRAECPIKVGDRLHKPTIDGFVQVLKERFGGDVNVAVASTGEKEHVTVTILLGSGEKKK